MSLTKPSYVEPFAGAPLKYKWDEDVALRFEDIENHKLYLGLDAASFRAKMALGCLATECILWRLSGHADLEDAFQRLTAAWAGVIDSAYVADLEFDVSDNDSDPVLGPLESALAFPSHASLLGRDCSSPIG